MYVVSYVLNSPMNLLMPLAILPRILDFPLLSSGWAILSTALFVMRIFCITPLSSGADEPLSNESVPLLPSAVIGVERKRRKKIRLRRLQRDRPRSVMSPAVFDLNIAK